MVTAKALEIKVKKSQEPIQALMTNKLKDPYAYRREIYFVRYIGSDVLQEDYQNEIANIVNELKNQFPYLYITHLKSALTYEETQKYSALFDKWKQLSTGSIEALFELEFPIVFKSDMMTLTMKLAFQKVMMHYEKIMPQSSETMKRNFGIKVLYWIKEYVPKLYQNPEQAIPKEIPKFVYGGTIKRQELLFLYYLSLLGCDVLYINPKEDLAKAYPECEAFSTLYRGKYTFEMEMPHEMKMPQTLDQKEIREVTSVREEPKNEVRGSIHFENRNRVNGTMDLSYEELAQCAASVVMITVKDQFGQCKATGSGVVIHSSGYILTNFHVVRTGLIYEVRFEKDDRQYETYQVVKYHSDYDLAIIKVERTCIPLPVYKGDKVIRGQKVVAIGSPLGLFNSVSDGIISGFRTFEFMEMIQFTAPTSHGSSGGALLNMHGELIGICTAGFDEGQNLNLAVDYQTLQRFASNYLEA